MSSAAAAPAPAWQQAYIRFLLARTHLLVGDQGQAIDLLEHLLTTPSTYSPGWLRIDPTFASLRGNPRFQRLIEGKM